jgi:hypothetical protein
MGAISKGESEFDGLVNYKELIDVCPKEKLDSCMKKY